MNTSLACVLQQGKQQAEAAFRLDWQPQIFFRLYQQVLDDCLHKLYSYYFSGCNVCLLAIGGYGRGEIYPYSDLDFALIVRDDLSDEQQELVSQLVQSLWDLGLKPAPQIGSLKQCLALAKTDLNTQTAFLEARLLAGDAAFAHECVTAFNAQLNVLVFTENKLLEMKQRHAKQASLVLEPNIKNGVGGLRDLHTMKWLAQAQGLQANFYALMRQRILTRMEASLLHTSHQRLARLRIELHLAAKREEDYLIFDLQEQLATQFGLDQAGKQDGIEGLMRMFYRTAKTVMQLNGILIPMLRNRISSTLPRHTEEIDEHYYHVNGQIAVKELDLFERQPEHLFKMMVLLQNRRDLHGIAPKTLRAWWTASRLITPQFYQNSNNRRYFLSFFQTEHGLTRILRLLNLYGILSRYLPDWHQIVGLLQHDLVHIYPVDDHILMVLRNMRRFAMERHSHELPFASAIFQNFPAQKHYILYLAALFHDIAKGRNGDHAKLGVTDAKRFGEDHFMPVEHSNLLCWLVEQHLLMSITAQKQDIQDPAVIARFAAQVQSHERLAALYLLTVADIRGTNPKIWNTWKAQLLQSLYQSTQQYLSGQSNSTENTILTRRQQAIDGLKTQSYSDKHIRSVIQALGDAYFVRHNSEQISWHLQHIAATPNQPLAALQKLDDNTWQAMVYMPNADRLFTRLCRIFGRHGLNIVAARAFLSSHHFILDTFTITLSSHHEEQQTIQAALLNDLQQFATQPQGNIGILRHKPKRRARWQPIVPRVVMYADEEHAQQYSIHLVAADRPYLLADVSEIFAQHRISLLYAKIVTLGERAEDSFIVMCSDWNASKEYALRQDLLAVLY